MKNKTGILGVLIIVAIIFIYFAYVIFEKDDNIYNPSENVIGSNDTNTEPLNTASSSSEIIENSEKSELFLSKDVITPEEKIVFFDLILKEAVTTDKIVINNCTAKPFSVKANKGSTLTIVNEGTQDYSFELNKKRVSILSGESGTYKIDDGIKDGLYGYACGVEGKSKTIGFVLVK